MAERKKRTAINWVQLREDYLHSNKELHEFSFESTQQPGSPSLSTLQKTSYKERWKDARDEIYHEQYLESHVKSQLIQESTHVTLVEARKKLLSSDLTILRHVEIAGSFQSMYLELLPKIRRASKLIDWDTLAESDPRNFVATLKDFSAILTQAVAIERQAMSLSDVKIELVASTKAEDVTREDLSGLDTVEIIARYQDSCRLDT